MNYAIVAKKDPYSYQVEAILKKTLDEAGWNYESILSLVICVGGDGTLLYAVHRYLNKMN